MSSLGSSIGSRQRWRAIRPRWRRARWLRAAAARSTRQRRWAFANDPDVDGGASRFLIVSDITRGRLQTATHQPISSLSGLLDAEPLCFVPDPFTHSIPAGSVYASFSYSHCVDPDPAVPGFVCGKVATVEIVVDPIF